MLRVANNLWIGGAYDELHAPVDAVLNVASDLIPTRRDKKYIEYIHLGLVDGPGNPPLDYIAVAVALASLMARGKKVLVCCHGGWSRSITAVIMYWTVMRSCPTTTNWKELWADYLSILSERMEIPGAHTIPSPHQAHLEAFAKIRWDMLSRAITEQVK